MAANLISQEPWRGGQPEDLLREQQSLLSNSKKYYKRELEQQRQEKERQNQEVVNAKRTDMLAMKQREEAMNKYKQDFKAAQMRDKMERSSQIQRQIQEKQQALHNMVSSEKQRDGEWLSQLQREEAELNHRRQQEKQQKNQEEKRLFQNHQQNKEYDKCRQLVEKAQDINRAQKNIEAANERERKLQQMRRQKSNEIDQKAQLFAPVKDKEREIQARKDKLIDKWTDDYNQRLQLKHHIEEQVRAQQSQELYQTLQMQIQERQARKDNEKRAREGERAEMNKWVSQKIVDDKQAQIQKNIEQANYRHTLRQQQAVRNPPNNFNSAFGSMDNSLGSFNSHMYTNQHRTTKSSDFMQKIDFDRHNPLFNPIGETPTRTSFAKGKGMSLLNAGNSISRY